MSENASNPKSDANGPPHEATGRGSQPLRLLSIGAHPADVFDQSGGTMAHHARRGDRVFCVVLTHGARVHDAEIADAMFHRQEVPDSDELEPLMRERSEVKADEVRGACDLLGVEEVYFFGADDAVLMVTDEAVRRLARLLREVRPDIILTHFPKEREYLTSPHAIAGQITLRAMALAASIDPGDRRPPHRVAQVFFFGTGAAGVRTSVWGAEGGYYNDVFVDIGDVIADKLAAMDHLVSQGYAGDYARKRLETSDGAQGSAARCSYAEGFIRMNSETHHYLPVTGRALELAGESDHEMIRRVSRRHDPDTSQ